MDEPVYVTKSFLPPREEFNSYVDSIWSSGILTNKGPLLQGFEEKVAEYLGVEYFQFVSNGTLALQLAINELGITEGEIITTPFSYVATTSAILWQRCTPVFVDIDKDTLNIDPEKIESSITSKTKAILAVHVFGNACDIGRIQDIADRNNLKVIYDGAHAFGAKYQDRSLLDNGDVSIVSFHATKLLHTIEGGGVISRRKDIYDRIELARSLGHSGDSHIQLGINAKANEFQAAMGLSNIKYVDDIIESRRKVSEIYDRELGGCVTRPMIVDGLRQNYAYYSVIFENRQQLDTVRSRLAEMQIYPRRYFYPSLNELPYLTQLQVCPVSEDVAGRILSLPFHGDIDESTIKVISRAIKDVVKDGQ